MLRHRNRVEEKHNTLAFQPCPDEDDDNGNKPNVSSRIKECYQAKQSA